MPDSKTLNQFKEELAKRKCPKCSLSLKIVEKKQKSMPQFDGLDYFVSCNNYPKCLHTEGIPMSKRIGIAKEIKEGRS